MIAWVRADVETAMARDAEEASPLETGGILLGYLDPTGAPVVTDVIGAGPAAVHRRFSFLPDHEWQEAELELRYEQSARITTYLGDWHTHPGGYLRPSWRDRRTAAAIATAPDARVPEPLVAILAGRSDWSLGVWRWDPSAPPRRALARAELRTFDRGDA